MRGGAWTLLLIALPWTWFLLRDAAGPITDVVAIVLPQLALLVAVGAGLVARRCRRALVLAVSTLVAGTVAVVGPWLPADAGAVMGRGVTVAGANVDGLGSPVAALGEISADVVVVLEPSVGVAAELEDA